MTKAAARAKKTTTRRAKPPSRSPRAGKAAADAGVSHEATLDAIFASLPEPVLHPGPAPEVVRRNRRARAQRRLLDALETRGPYPLTEMVRAELQRTAERWAQRDFVDSFAEAEELELRYADERAVLDAAARGDEEARFEAAEQIHRRRVEKRYGRIEMRGLQLPERVYQDLEMAYVPLHVEDPSEGSPLPDLPAALALKTGKVAKDAIDALATGAMMRMLGAPRIPAIEALARHARLLIAGGPGSGKSTLVAYLATRAARGDLAREAGWDAEPVPFVVPVRSLPTEGVSLAVLAAVADTELWFLEAALDRGRALLLVDGLDEARIELARELLPTLTTLLKVNADNRALVTTRPSGLRLEDASVPLLAQVELTSMTRDEVGTFIDKWCLAAELSLRKARAQAESEAKAAALDLKQRIRERSAIEKLAQTPLLCSVICVVHRFLGQQIPQRRVVLYEAITNVLLYEWDRAKFPEGSAIGKLDATAKRALLARLACSMHAARVAELSEHEVVRLFEVQLPDLGRPAEEARAMIAEIRDRSGVLVERRPGSFGFSHLTFQEYLTAFEVVHRHEEPRLVDNYKDEWWHEVIVLAAGFPGADTAGMVARLLRQDGDEVAKGTMLAAQCVDTAIELPATLRKEIEDRLTKLVPPQSLDDCMRLVQMGNVSVPVLLQYIDSASAGNKIHSLVVLGALAHETSIGAVSKLLVDGTRAEIDAFNVESVKKRLNSSVASWAAAIAAMMLSYSDAAFTALLKAIPQAHPTAISTLRRTVNLPYFASGRDRIHALLRRYDEAHPTSSPSASPPPKRAARSG